MANVACSEYKLPNILGSGYNQTSIPSIFLSEVWKSSKKTSAFSLVFYISRCWSKIPTKTHLPWKITALAIHKHLSRLSLAHRDDVACRHFAWKLFRFYEKGIDPEVKKEFDMRTVSTEVALLENAMEEGLEKGLEQGRASTILDLAKKMLAAQEPISKIAQYTGYTEEGILALQKELSI
jgi:hypothetical protein